MSVRRPVCTTHAVGITVYLTHVCFGQVAQRVLLAVICDCLHPQVRTAPPWCRRIEGRGERTLRFYGRVSYRSVYCTVGGDHADLNGLVSRPSRGLHFDVLLAILAPVCRNVHGEAHRSDSATC